MKFVEDDFVLDYIGKMMRVSVVATPLVARISPTVFISSIWSATSMKTIYHWPRQK
jgi:hypothetical protein